MLSAQDPGPVLRGFHHGPLGASLRTTHVPAPEVYPRDNR